MSVVKQRFVNGVLDMAKTLAETKDLLASARAVYFDRGYNSGGSDPIIDDDISGLGVTATQLTNMMTLAEQLENFFGNSAVSTADYDASLNQFRRDL